MMTKIFEAINTRWVNALRQQQTSRQIVADSINALFEQDENDVAGKEDEKDEDEVDGTPTPRELYPDVYEFETRKCLKQTYTTSQSHSWSDLYVPGSAPQRGDPGVTVKMGDLRYTLCKNGEEWSRLKTPKLIRELRMEKARAA